MLIRGIAATAAIDSSGEILKIDGADISDMLAGKCYLNYEHNSAADDMVGIVTYAKKIYEEEDCENDKQIQCWRQTLLPMVYFEGRLFDKEGHVGAICVASIIRSFANAGKTIEVGVSVEGSTVKRGSGDEHHVLEKTIVRRLSVTMRPCNKQCMIFLESDDASDIMKSEPDWEQINTLPVPKHGFIEIEDPIEDIYYTINELHKTLTAGSSNVAPSQMTQGAALTRENLSPKMHDVGIQTRVKSAMKRWDKKKPLRQHLKSELEDLSDEYIDNFAKLAEDLEIRKRSDIKKTELVRIDDTDGNNKANYEQKALISGINLPPDGGQHFRVMNDHGQTINVKPSRLTESGSETAKNAAAYYAAAKDFFEMGDHVPVTAYFAHQTAPMEGSPLFVATEHAHGNPAIVGNLFEDSLGKDKDLLHKIAIMDLILGHSRRNYGNIILGDKPKLIDNEMAFQFDGKSKFHSDHNGGDIMSSEVQNWLSSKDPKKLASVLSENNINLEMIKKALIALKTAQSMCHHPIGSIMDTIHIAEPSPEVVQ